MRTHTGDGAFRETTVVCQRPASTTYYKPSTDICKYSLQQCVSMCMYTHVLSASSADASATEVLETVASLLASDANESRLRPAEYIHHPLHAETCHCHLYTVSRTSASESSQPTPVGDHSASN